MCLRRELLALSVALGAIVCLLRVPEPPTLAAQPKAEKANAAFKTEGVAFLKKHCLACHSGEKPKADLALDKYADDVALLKDRKTWARVLDVLKAGEMPPPAKPQP